MLENSLFESEGQQKTRKPMTVVVSVAAHVVTVVVLVLIPLWQTQALTIPPVDMSLLLPHIEQPRSIAVFRAGPRVARNRPAADSNAFTVPSSIPQQTILLDPPSALDIPFMPAGGAGDRLSTLIAGLPNAGIEIGRPLPPPPPPVAPAPPPPPKIDARPIRQGGDVQAAKLIYQVKPVYPPLARQTRIRGVVVLEAVIARDGSINSLRVIEGHPLLNQAALDAVRQWRYSPTLLNSEPVEVVTTVTVTFTLQ